MLAPTIECVGVYLVPCDEQKWREELEDSYRILGVLSETEDFRRRVISIVLVEVIFSAATSSLDAGDFAQWLEKDDRYPQVAYDEALLSPDGDAVLASGHGSIVGITAGRMCFFLHYYDPTRPIQWTYGEFNCPAPSPMPERLARIVSYQPI